MFNRKQQENQVSQQQQQPNQEQETTNPQSNATAGAGAENTSQEQVNSAPDVASTATEGNDTPPVESPPAALVVSTTDISTVTFEQARGALNGLLESGNVSVEDKGLISGFHDSLNQLEIFLKSRNAI